MKKNSKRVDKVKFLLAELKNKKINVELIKVFSDNSTKTEKIILSNEVTSKLLKAKTQKEFATLVNDNFVAVAHLDAQAKKQALTKNTQYCTSRNVLARACNMLQFAEVAYRQRHEAHKTLKKYKVAKQAKQAKQAKKVKQVKKVKA